MNLLTIKVVENKIEITLTSADVFKKAHYLILKLICHLTHNLSSKHSYLNKQHNLLKGINTQKIMNHKYAGFHGAISQTLVTRTLSRRGLVTSYDVGLLCVSYIINYYKARTNCVEKSSLLIIHSD
jgi:hypothetical protein